jgi:hypothetical protein
MTPEPFNPLAMESLASSIVTRMMEMDAVPLDRVTRFAGAGMQCVKWPTGGPVRRTPLRLFTPPWGPNTPPPCRDGGGVPGRPRGVSFGEA